MLPFKSKSHPDITIVIKYAFPDEVGKASKLLTPCEVAVKCALPSVRVMIANELMNKYNLKQAKAAKLLGVTQPAISLYQKKLRGTAINLENDTDITALFSKHADYLVKGSLTHKEIILSFCEICKTLRAKGFLCENHKAFDPTIETECGYCQTLDPRL